jgi:hypothetical protein
MMEIISRDAKENTSAKLSAKKSSPKVKDEGSDKSNRKEPTGKSAKVPSPKKDQQNSKVSASKNTATPSPEKSNRQKSNTKQKSGKSSVKSGAPANTGNRKKTKLAKEGVDYNTRYKIADWNIVSKETPPAFITQTQFDPYVDASLAYYLALKDAGVPAELHMLPKGPHGHQNPKVFEMLIRWLKSYKF